MCRPSMPIVASEESASAGASLQQFAKATADADAETTVATKQQVQSPARAIKRQRQRERRKMGFPDVKVEDSAAEVLAKAEPACDTPSQEDSNQTASFEARAAEVAKEAKLVVKGTFFDVESPHADPACELAAFDTKICKSLLDLPPAEFETTAEVDEWRRNYRMFRLGYHVGARGELPQTSPRRASLDDVSTAAASDESTASASDESPVDMCTNFSEKPEARFVRSLRWADGEDSEAECSQNGSTTSSQLSGRAAKRQRQRDRRKLGKLEASDAKL